MDGHGFLKYPFKILQAEPQDFWKIVKNARQDSLYHRLVSTKNLRRIQKGIVYGVYRATQGHYLIDYQDEHELREAVTYIYRENPGPDLQDLNNLCIRLIVPRIVEQLKFHDNYLHNLDIPITPLSLPKNVSRAGSKILEYHPGI